MEKVYRAILRDLFQVVIGELVSETDDVLVLRRPALLGIQTNGKDMNIQFVPFDLINAQPPVSLKALLEANEELIDFTFNKRSIISDNVPLNSQIFNGYSESLKPKSLITPSTELVGLDGNPLNSDKPPVVQNLF